MLRELFLHVEGTSHQALLAHINDSINSIIQDLPIDSKIAIGDASLAGFSRDQSRDVKLAWCLDNVIACSGGLFPICIIFHGQ